MASDLKGGPFHMAHILPDPSGEAPAPNRVLLTDDSAGQPRIDGVIDTHIADELETTSDFAFIGVHSRWAPNCRFP